MKPSLYWPGILVIAVAAGAIGASALTPRQVNASSPPATVITVVGTSSKTVTPNTAVLSLGVLSQASSAATALSDNNQALSHVVAALKALKIPAKDLETNGLSINPQYGNGNPAPLTGYQVSDNLTVTISQISQVGVVIDQAVKAGANQVNGVSFTGGSSHTAYQSPFAGALANALLQARAIAADLHERVAGVVSIQVVTPSSGGGMPYALNVPAAAMYAPTLVYPGHHTESVSLRVQYRLLP